MGTTGANHDNTRSWLEHVVAVPRIVHDPIDRERDDRVAGDPSDLAEGVRLLVAEVFEDLERDEQVIAAIGDRPRDPRRVVDDDRGIGGRGVARLEDHDIRADDERLDVRAQLQR